jgi:hypothetical protein
MKCSIIILSSKGVGRGYIILLSKGSLKTLLLDNTAKELKSAFKE